MSARLAPLAWAAWTTPFVFFTGKGGVGKTTVAGASAVALADAGHQVLLVCTDPASNLDDVFGVPVGAERSAVAAVPGLDVMNLDPEAAAASYRERVIDPYRGIVSGAELRAIEEQLAGECTVEVAAFDQFTRLIVREDLIGAYDHVVFDTAPSGHTLRLMNLPQAWSDYIETSPDAASCLGPRSGLRAQRDQYRAAVGRLADPAWTELVLVSRPDRAALREAGRTGTELAAHGIRHQRLVVNGILQEPLAGDTVAEAFAGRQDDALRAMPDALLGLSRFAVPMVAFDVTGVPALRALAAGRRPESAPARRSRVEPALPGVGDLVAELAAAGPGAVLVMGKGGVGKSTIAAVVAVGLARRGQAVHLSTTDPAGRLGDVLEDDVPEGLTVSRIDPAAELATYTADHVRAAEGMTAERRALLEEDLRSPCTEELAVFRAFGRVLGEARAGRRHVVLDTAPTGHTLRLLDLTGSYHQQALRAAPDGQVQVTTPLMRLRDPRYARVLVVTLAERTPVSESAALQEDLRSAGIEPFGWVVNATLVASGTRDPVLQARALLEDEQLDRIRGLAQRTWIRSWQIGP